MILGEEMKNYKLVVAKQWQGFRVWHRVYSKSNKIKNKKRDLRSNVIGGYNDFAYTWSGLMVYLI